MYANKESLMRSTRTLLSGIAILALACGGRSRQQEAETASADSAARVADSISRSASSGKMRVATVMIGKRLGAENRIAEPTFQFAPQDTVYLSVGVEGAPSQVELSARWLAQTGKVLDSISTSVSQSPSIEEFHLAPDQGWKPGTYLVTLFLDGDSVDAKTFAVRK